MKITVLGCHGGEGPTFKPTSFLINENIAIDAGALTSSLTVEALKKIKYIFITHAHLDHVKDLAFMADTLFEQISSPIQIYSRPSILNALKEHLFNDVLWPDFTKLPSPQNPTVQLIPLNKPISIEGLTFEAIDVTHVVDSVGYLISGSNMSIAITGDTGPTVAFWEKVKSLKDLKAIFAEVSFPSSHQQIADDSLHYTPKTLQKDLAKVPSNIPIYLYHLKPQYILEITKELTKMGVKWSTLSLAQTLKF